MANSTGLNLASWRNSATGATGFWRLEHVRDHFQTSTATPVLADLVATLADAVAPGISSVVDIGCGDGALMAALRAARPMWDVCGIDIRSSPTTDPHWYVDEWDVESGSWTVGVLEALCAKLRPGTLVICHEFLDDLPCHLGYPRTEAEQMWADHWWPGGSELGLTRDRAWANIIAALSTHGGLALCIDYGHVARNRPTASTVRGYRDGRPADVATDGSVNITADVAMDSLAAAGVAAGAHTAWFTQQRDVVDLFSHRVLRHQPDLLTRSHLTALASDRAAGRWWWLAQRVER